MPPPGPQTLIGRRAELDVVRRLVAGVPDGHGATLLVTGEAGIGKSRLLAEVARAAAAAGLVVFTGRATPGGGTYRPVAEALAAPLRGLAHGLTRDEPAWLRPFRTALSQLTPSGGATAESTRIAGDDPWAMVDPAVLLGEGVLALLQEQDAGRGCAVLLEDLHWADADTLRLTAYLADTLPGTRVLLAVTARDDAASSASASLAELSARPSVTSLRLRRFDAQEVGELAAARRGDQALSPAELRTLTARSAGLPFLVEELLDVGLEDERIPPTLAGLVTSRLAQLSARARAVVVAASVASTDPDWRLLAEVTGQSDDEVLDALRAATEAGLLVPDAGPLRWRHALTREAVRGSLLSPEHAVIAGRIARVLDDRGTVGDRSAAAALFVTAGEPGRAAEILMELARRDATRGALRSADELLERAAATGRFPGPVAAERVRVLTLLGRVTDALAVGTDALREATVRGDDHAELCLRLARAAVAAGRWAEAQQWIERAGRPDDVRALVLAADAAVGAGDLARAGPLAGAAVRAAERSAASPDGAAVLCEALMVLGRASKRQDVPASMAPFRRAAQVAAEHALTPWLVEALFSLGALEVTVGDPEAPSLAEARRLAEEHGMIAQVAQADLLRANAVLMVHGPGPALEILLATAERAGSLRNPAQQAVTELIAAAVAALALDEAGMAALLDRASSRPHASIEVVTLGPVVRALPYVLDHDLPRACALVDEGVSAILSHASAAPIWYFGLWALLRTAVDDRGDEARETLRHHHSLIGVVNRAGLLYADAVATGRAGRPAQAEDLFAEADRLMSTLPWWNRLLRSIVLASSVKDGWGDPVPKLREQLAVHERAGEEPLARTCRALLRAAGAPTRRPRGGAAVPPHLRSYGITAREAEVLAGVADHLTNAQIAARLFLSRRTVETHVASLLTKTGTADRNELRAWAESPPGGR